VKGLLNPPLDCLKPLADGVWTVDGPLAWFGMPWPKFPFPTRMTVLSLERRRLFIHSPTPLTSQLGQEIGALGAVSWIIGPNRLHYSWLDDWHGGFPDAAIYFAPGIREVSPAIASIPATALDHNRGYPWDGEITTLCVPGRYMTEVAFFHHPSRTLVLTDLIECFETDHIDSLWLRLLIRLGGVAAPTGGTPRDLRFTFNRNELRTAVETMLGWQPERVIFAHGRFYHRDGARQLEQAFAWLLR
jgi:hypothetical protein